MGAPVDPVRGPLYCLWNDKKGPSVSLGGPPKGYRKGVGAPAVSLFVCFMFSRYDRNYSLDVGNRGAPQGFKHKGGAPAADAYHPGGAAAAATATVATATAATATAAAAGDKVRLYRESEASA